MIVAKDTVHDEVPLCLGLGETGNAVKLVPCFYEDVLPSLVKDWATGAVISDEVMLQNRWEVGPCTSDGHVERLYERAETKEGLHVDQSDRLSHVSLLCFHISMQPDGRNKLNYR
jgi:hypothetical protein